MVKLELLIGLLSSLHASAAPFYSSNRPKTGVTHGSITQGTVNVNNDSPWNHTSHDNSKSRPNHGRCTKPQIRPEWRNMAPAQQHAYMEAERCLFSQPATSGLAGASNRIEDLAAAHEHLTTYIHENALFLPWHRYMLHAHETLLRTECNYHGPMPWWDETRDAGRFKSAPMFTPEFFGTLPPAPGSCVVDGAFAGFTLTVGPGPAITNHCLSRGANETLSATVTRDSVDYCNAFSDYISMYYCVYYGPHADGHAAVGGVMVDIDSSPGDPIFYLHHAMIDRNWWQWQRMDPERRLQAMKGSTLAGCQPEAHCSPPATLDMALHLRGIIPSASVRDIMDTMGGYLCYEYDY